MRSRFGDGIHEDQTDESSRLHTDLVELRSALLHSEGYVHQCVEIVPNSVRSMRTHFANGYFLKGFPVSRLIAQGGDIAVAQAVAGHSSAATTLRIYSHLTAKRLETVADKYDPGLTRS